LCCLAGGEFTFQSTYKMTPKVSEEIHVGQRTQILQRESITKFTLY